MNASEIRGLNEDQIAGVLEELHSEWQTLRFQEAIGRLTATSRIGQIRKDIARIHTIRTERVMDAAIRQMPDRWQLERNEWLASQIAERPARRREPKKLVGLSVTRWIKRSLSQSILFAVTACTTSELRERASSWRTTLTMSATLGTLCGLKRLAQFPKTSIGLFVKCSNEPPRFSGSFDGRLVR